jgi:hypothetical protein
VVCFKVQQTHSSRAAQEIARNSSVRNRYTGEELNRVPNLLHEA